MVLGGPGTGKTSILLNLLIELDDIGTSCGIVMPSQVVDYVEASMPGFGIRKYLLSLSDLSDPELADSLDVLLTAPCLKGDRFVKLWA